MSDSDRAAAARRRAVAKFRFYRHLAIFVIVNFGLVLINIATGLDSFWALWPMLGWGIAIIIHALSVFVLNRGEDIIDRMTEREMQKDDLGKP